MLSLRRIIYHAAALKITTPESLINRHHFTKILALEDFYQSELTSEYKDKRQAKHSSLKTADKPSFQCHSWVFFRFLHLYHTKKKYIRSPNPYDSICTLFN